MENEPQYTFFKIEDIIVFVDWVKANFESTEEYNDWFEFSLDEEVPYDLFCKRQPKKAELLHECLHCGAKFSTVAGLNVHNKVLHKNKMEDDFWKIINESYNKEPHETELPDTD